MHRKNPVVIAAVILVFFIFLAGCTATGIRSEPGTTTTVILIRHAERDAEGHLTDKGRKRAKDLVDAVEDRGLTAIYSINMERNLDTVKPLAEKLGIDITLTPDISIFMGKKIVSEILTKHAGGVILWVGNVSGNLQAVYRQLGGTGKGPLEYGDLYILTIPDQGSVTVEKSRYGTRF